MSRFTRRRFLAATGVAAAAGAARQLTGPTSAQAAPLKLEPEKGAVLRWKRFVQGDEELFMANARRYTQLTGVDLRPKAAVAANVGAGPDIIISTDEQPHLYPDKLLDVTDVAEYLGQKYGGWYPLHDGARAIRALATRAHRLRLASAARLRLQSGVDGRPAKPVFP